MDKKDILMVVVIAAVVGVVASLITTNVSGDASLSPRIIIAHACNGDKVCEMDNALILGSLEVKEINSGNLIISGDSAANAVEINPNTDTPIQSNAYRGHIQRAYACFTPEGRLFRSEGRCNSLE